MKIGIYAPAKNELKHVEAWVNSCADADIIVVADTGSTDGTREKLLELGVKVSDIRIVPWRFDDAFNSAMYLLPDDVDVCIRLDLDERLHTGWRLHLENAWTPTTTRLRYRYIWSWLPDGSPGKTWNGDRIHLRRGYRWKGVTHEYLYSRLPEIQTHCDKLEIHHFADWKNKKSDLDFLLESQKEWPHDTRWVLYTAREYMYRSEWQKCIEECDKFIKMNPWWNVERAASYMYSAKSYRELNKHHEAQLTALKATIEMPDAREPWLELARSASKNRDYYTCYYAATKCLSIKEKTNQSISDADAYGWEPFDLAALSSYYLEKYSEAVEFGIRSLELSPNDTRLKTNLEFYLAKNTKK